MSMTVIVAITVAGALLLAAWLWVSKRGLRPVPDALRPGQPLPDFHAQDEQGDPVRSTALHGSPTVILFVRGNWCPFCSKQVKNLTAFAEDHAITIAVMGCRVNGPGETDAADLGLWCGPEQVNLKRGGDLLGAFAYDQILPRLKSELEALIAKRAGG